MKYIVDGHNLIPKLGWSLQALDDEMRLVNLLLEFCRIKRAQVEVFFDRAPAGQSGRRSFGAVSAHFVRQGSTADVAIMSRVIQLGKTAANWTVVSSDQRVQTAARAERARVIRSEEFAGQVRQALESSPGAGGSGAGSLSAGEVEEWLHLFGQKKGENS